MPAGAGRWLHMVARAQPQQSDATGEERPPVRLPGNTFFLPSAEPTAGRLRITPIRGLSHPWSLGFLPDGMILITERPGRLRVLRDGVLDPKPARGAPAVHVAEREGLMDLAVHPEFPRTRWVFLSYHKPLRDGGSTVAVARGRWNGETLTGVKDIFVAGDRNLGAPRLAFGPGRLLYVGIGATDMDAAGPRAQNLADYAGKVLRITDEGKVPPDNPFVKETGARPEIFSRGHGQMTGLVPHPATSEIWAAEQRMSGPDLVYGLEAGGNYGTVPAPAVTWTPSIGVSGMAFYANERVRAWRHHLFVAGVQAGTVRGTGQLQRIVFNERREEIRREPMLRELQQRLRDVRVGRDGALYVLTDEEQGTLLRIDPEPAPRTSPPAPRR